MKLSELSSIRNGVTFSGKLAFEPFSEGGNSLIPIIQFKNLEQGRFVDVSSLGYIPSDGLKDYQILRPGDLVFRSRSLANFALLVPESLPESVLSSPLFSIKIHDRNRILPGYLQWYINQLETQKKIQGMVLDSGQPMINKRDFENLDVILPPLEVQKKILDLSILSGRELRILDEIKKKKELFISSYLMQFAKEQSI